eukprot:s6073_g1.t1
MKSKEKLSSMKSVRFDSIYNGKEAEVGMQAPNPDARALRQTLEALSLDAGLGRRLRQQMLLAAQSRSKAVTEVDFSSFQAELGAFVAIVASLQAHSPRKPTAVREAVRQPSTKTPRQEG